MMNVFGTEKEEGTAPLSTMGIETVGFGTVDCKTGFHSALLNFLLKVKPTNSNGSSRRDTKGISEHLFGSFSSKFTVD